MSNTPKTTSVVAATDVPDIPYTGPAYYEARLTVRGPWPGKDAPHNIRLEADVSTAVMVTGHVGGPARKKAAHVMAEQIFREVMGLSAIMDAEGARVSIEVWLA